MHSEKNGPSAFGEPWIAQRNEIVLVTGAGGFVGSRVVANLLDRGFTRVRCFVRPSSDLSLLNPALAKYGRDKCELIEGNLLSLPDCERAVAGAAVVYHLVAGRGKSAPSCFQGSVITTRNLLDAVVHDRGIKRFVNVSSFAVYSNWQLPRGAVWDESCELEQDFAGRYDAYAYAKARQDELVLAYHQKHRVPFTVVRPGIVFGPGKKAIPGFVGIDTFGVFFHLGGRYAVPLTYVDNCADAIVLAGLVPGMEGEIFNVVDDQLPTSREFLRQYKQQAHNFRSLRIPFRLAYELCRLWERYAEWSQGQLPPVFNRRMCTFAWRGHRYSNEKLKARLGWRCRVPMADALARYFEFQKYG